MGVNALNKILFLDIDGPMIPGRAYMLSNQTEPLVKTFDPVAVSLVNAACKNRRKIVIHSSWIRTGLWTDDTKTVKDHCVEQGIEEALFHEDWSCDPDISWRYLRINAWLAKHPEVTDFVAVDDTPDPDGFIGNHLLLVDFEDGLLTKDFRRIRDGDWRRNEKST